MRKTFVLMLLIGLGLFAWGSPQELPLPERATGLGLAWSPDGSGIVVLYRGDEGGVAERLEVPSGESRWRATGLKISTWKHPLAFSPDGKELAIGEWSGVRLLDATDGTTLRTIELEERFHPLALAFRPDGTLAMAVEEVRGLPGSLYLELRDRTGALMERRPLGKRFTPAPRPEAAFSPDGRWLAFAAGTDEEPGGEVWFVHLLDLESGSIRMWDLRELAPELPWAHLRVQIAGVTIRPDGREIAVGLYAADSGRPLVLRLDTETGELIGRLFPLEWEEPYIHYVVEELAYSFEGDFLAFSAYSPDAPATAFRTLAVANLIQEEPEVTLLCQNGLLGECPIRSPCFSPDGRTLASLWWNKIQLWNLCPEIAQLPDPAWAFSFSSGGAYHPEGLGEWRVRLDASGRFEVAHQVMDEVEDFGPFQLEPEENRRIWELIEAVDIPNRKSSTRPGVPDEVQYTFALGSATCLHKVTLWINDAREDEALMALVEAIAALIEKYTGQVPWLG